MPHTNGLSPHSQAQQISLLASMRTRWEPMRGTSQVFRSTSVVSTSYLTFSKTSMRNPGNCSSIITPRRRAFMSTTEGVALSRRWRALWLIYRLSPLTSGRKREAILSVGAWLCKIMGAESTWSSPYQGPANYATTEGHWQASEVPCTITLTLPRWAITSISPNTKRPSWSIKTNRCLSLWW